ncbi:MAG: 5-oxoprolinase subunit PxpA [Neomegalonema sp.]|nr:5-oxoprolinase subunit PxpA [Neomegalonema sp.]
MAAPAEQSRASRWEQDDSMRININADLGEGFGAYDIGDDAALLDIVATANIACGFHGGDPSVMRRTMAAAAARGVSIGAHPGFNDLWGFGRRAIRMQAAEIEHMVAYQIGAALGVAALVGAEVSHVKAHGALNNMACADADYAAAIARAVRAVDRDLIHLTLPNTELERQSLQVGCRTAREAFVDRSYEADGGLTPRSMDGAVLTEPAIAAARAVAMVREGAVTARTGERVALTFDSLCVHGDEPTAVAVAKAAKAALMAAGAQIETLPKMMAGR